MAQQFIFLTSDATMPLLEGGTVLGTLDDGPEIAARVGKSAANCPALSAQQFKMLWLLYESHGEVVSRPDLVAAVWGMSRPQAYLTRRWMH